MTQAALVKAAGISERTLRDLEKGLPSSIETHLAVRAVLGLPSIEVETHAPSEEMASQPPQPRRRPMHVVVADTLILASIVPGILTMPAAIHRMGSPMEVVISLTMMLLTFAPALMATLSRASAAVKPDQERTMHAVRGLLGLMLVQPTITDNAHLFLVESTVTASLTIWVLLLALPSLVLLLDALLPPAIRIGRSAASTASDEVRVVAAMSLVGGREILGDLSRRRPPCI
jgi:DNA-binding XRE family transcriptional regulator